jgi:hypothetical protein
MYSYCSKIISEPIKNGNKRLSNYMPSNVLVSDAGNELVNGTYTYRGINAGKPYYNLEGLPDNPNQGAITWTGFWYITTPAGNPGYFSMENVEYPWQVVTWVATPASATPTVTEIALTVNETPENGNTFGLPADVVALITSRFGTVANFLRLRNQGQI